jgi:RNA 2'-phosphotransferase, Tpt1 / KptA family
MTKRLTEVSKFLSYVLRHRPDAIGLTLDREGWADISALITAATQAGTPLDRALIQQVVATSDKKRFAISAVDATTTLKNAALEPIGILREAAPARFLTVFVLVALDSDNPEISGCAMGDLTPSS